jgi:hypothetical protein
LDRQLFTAAAVVVVSLLETLLVLVVAVEVHQVTHLGVMEPQIQAVAAAAQVITFQRALAAAAAPVS